MTVFGERLKIARKLRGLNQEDLAVVLGVNRSMISNYENGTNRADQVKLGRLAEALKVSADYLLGLSDDPTPSQPEAPDPEVRAIRRSMEGLTEEERQDILDYIAWKRAQHLKKQQERNQKGEQDAL